MSGYKLVAPLDAAREFARVFLDSGAAKVEVLEEKCFLESRYWSLGDVVVDGNNTEHLAMHSAVCKGRYVLQIRELEAASADLQSLLGISEPNTVDPQTVKDQHKKILRRVDRILDAVATSAVRVGLVHPIFDPNSIEGMPFRRSTTVIADTSGALQGGLDFVARFLHPAARIKIPAIVHMEVVNQADSFLKRRRGPKINTSALLFDHLLSQAGQRVLLRLELQADTEIERTLLVGDPLRNAFQKEGEPEWADLNLSVPLRACV